MLRKILGIFMIIGIVSCSGNSVKKDQLIVAVPVEAISLDPYGSNDNASARIHSQIFERLINLDGNGEFVPSLATEWKYLSPTVLQMKIRDNVFFHNGEALTAKDVKFSIERMLNSSVIQHIVDPIKGVEIVDNHTVNILLKEPFSPLLAHLSHVTLGIMNEKAVNEASGNVDQQPIGTGPFKFTAWNRGQNILLEKNQNYWGTPARLESIEFRTVPEASARTIVLETGEADIVYDIDAVDRERVSENPNLRLIEQAIPRIEYIGMNINKNSLWKNPKVREAIAYAIDTKGIINSVLFGAGIPADSIIYKTVIGHYDGLKPRERDIEKAKALLKEAGVPEGMKITMWTTEGQRQKILEIVQANLREIGIDASIEVYEWARFIDGTAKGEHDVFILGWTAITGDADYGIYNLAHSSAWGGPGNRSFYSNNIVDNKLDAARKEQNPEKRDSLYKDIQEILYNDVAIIPLFYKFSNVGTSKYIKGFIFDPTDAHALSTVYKE